MQNALVTPAAPVAAVVVNAVQAEPCRALTEKAKEILKLPQSLANGNAAATIAMPSLVFGIAATLDHGAPDLMFRRTGAPVLQMGLARCLALQTAAGEGKPAYQAALHNNNRIAAIADAGPARLFKRIAVAESRHCEAAK